MAEPFSEFVQRQLATIQTEGLLRKRRLVEPLGEGRCRLNGRELWDFSSNDYHGLANHREVIAAACESTRTHGLGARASVLISGWTPAHQALRDQLATFEAVEDVLLCSSGYAACQGAIAALVKPGDLVFCDRLNHACLIDGCRLSGGSLRVFRHSELDALERQLQKFQSHQGRRWIVTETVFGMDGVLAPLARLVELAEQYDATIICDEAHATGVYGSTGQGAVTELRESGHCDADLINRRIAVRVGTLSKSLGSQGGFVAGSAALIQLLWNTARPLMFSTGLSVAACGGAAAAIRILQDDPDRCSRLRKSSVEFRQTLRDAGLTLLGDSDSPIVSVVLEDPDRTMNWASELEVAGFLVGAIRPPTVPHNTARLRISLSSVHSPDVLNELTQVLLKLHETSHV
ncbi:aminotransferase class I/II-fold pyridoxal phosphate-dependent enzyme [Rubinisphaera margarita]|uniref:aminotransferase class I/II-fold pyridoxal phosphate-dependent enzyme n=1 Tax=Rubinisphaera margarita TaxID=2909586 RepID=UPI001EE823F5|nr:8-amino-7-oxononanoate synthase [Rubinisphaera margarita]MCG6157210.1 8-amino-7-oxononanoate synthase [Rubinisphaera margarita]